MPAPRVAFADAMRVWARVAALSFGGPAGQIAVMHRILVEEKRWISEDRFLHALNYCMLLPGPEAQQLAIYIGWLLHRGLGGLFAGILFVLPGFLSILALSLLYAISHGTAFTVGLLFGLKAAVLALVVEAVWRIGKRALRNRVMTALAAAAFLAIFFFDAPFPLIVAAAAAVGMIGGRLRPDLFYILRPAPTGELASDQEDVPLTHVEPSLRRTLRVLLLGALLWFGPILLLIVTLGGGHVLVTEALFFSQAAVVTFGGAYSVLAYIAQQAVETYGWLQPGEMLDGLGMAETTPGPLIQVVQFVGFLGAYRHPEPFTPITAAVLGSIVTTWVTFVPCFIWIFLGAPYIERLREHAILSSALSAVTASVVGVVLNLAVWFGLHVAFGTVDELWMGPLRLLVPELATIRPLAIALAAFAFLALFRWHWSVVRTLGVSCAAGLLLELAL